MRIKNEKNLKIVLTFEIFSDMILICEGANQLVCAFLAFAAIPALKKAAPHLAEKPRSHWRALAARRVCCMR
jgi:hypothetical protein